VLHIYIRAHAQTLTCFNCTHNPSPDSSPIPVASPRCFTRPYAALVLFAIAVSGGVMCPTGTSALVVLWMGLSLAVFLFYFVFLPESGEVPFWCESVGPIKASMDPNVWEQLATQSIPDDWSPGAAYQYEYAYSSISTPQAGPPPAARKTVAV